ncbi:MAG: hypothetical protein DWQ34_10720 [Planctomycetota bacterium]|nr:MAG: hypothetical protein DWQ34_10720 [Planctomycetota bacterium]REK20757.1 MAG: hypothetical protein DWQ41_24240 [Planctomycetota bacterium]REK38061.1 MAG: hypothetical protein DWQ45_05310 [Planctomycetota bacterium]
MRRAGNLRQYLPTSDTHVRYNRHKPTAVRVVAIARVDPCRTAIPLVPISVRGDTPADCLMEGRLMNRCFAALVLVAFATIASDSRADDCARPPVCCKPAGSCATAIECIYCCRPVVKRETVEKEGFDVECEYICVPGIKWPWQKCCEKPSCGKVKKVRKLVKREWECGEKCVWEWELSCCCRAVDCKPFGLQDRCAAAAPCAPMH